MTRLVAWWSALDKHQREKWFWRAATIPTLLWWKESVLWVAIMSLYANQKTADGAHEARESQGCSECDHCRDTRA